MLSYFKSIINCWRTAFYKTGHGSPRAPGMRARCIFTCSSPPFMADTLPLVFHDGHCGLCDRCVRWLMRRDRGGKLHFAPLQGTTAAALLEHDVRSDASSMVLQDADGVHVRSEAVIRAVMHLGGSWRLARVLRLVPRALRDAVYDMVAKRRHRWFGSVVQCNVPEREGSARFLP